MPLHPRVIVNADDFGMSSSVNRAVLLAFQNNWITRASIMANMPGFGEACEMARSHGWTGKIGLHLNLSEGRPLTGSIRRCPRFCDRSGDFLPWRRIPYLRGDEQRAVSDEFEAQCRACLDQGIHPTHLDSHHHHHTEWPIGTLVIRLAKKYEIRAVRLSRNCGPDPGLVKRLYKLVFNSRLRFHGVASTRYFGSVQDVYSILDTSRGAVEIMVHPRMSGDHSVTDMGDGKDLEALLRGLPLPELESL